MRVKYDTIAHLDRVSTTYLACCRWSKEKPEVREIAGKKMCAHLNRVSTAELVCCRCSEEKLEARKAVGERSVADFGAAAGVVNPGGDTAGGADAGGVDAGGMDAADVE